MGLLKEQFDRAFLSVYHGIYDDYKSYFLSGGIFNVFLLWLKERGSETPEKVADRTKDILVKLEGGQEARFHGGAFFWYSKQWRVCKCDTYFQGMV